ncbi:MAG: NAD(P)-dependent alcohol dehydrogenase [Nitrospirota bacterium]|nr:NAD(P)-dependent alcohol dehydrogenase [Nitrospirota bacterium]
MKAIVQDRYGSPDEVLRLREIEMPAVGDDDVLVRVRAASVHADVWHVVTGQPYVLRLMGGGFSRPKNPVPGTDMAGIVEAVGRNVTRFRPGDEVFGETVKANQWTNGGAFAEYVSAHHGSLEIKPRNVGFEQAAGVPTSGLIVLNNLQGQRSILPGQKVLINGAAGGVGSLAVQIAKARGAVVTGVDSAAKLEMVRSLGADRVIDYRSEDFTRSGERYDLIIDVASTLSLADSKRALAPAGLYVLIGHDHYGKARRPVLGSLPRFFLNAAISSFVRQLGKSFFEPLDRRETMPVLRELLEAGKITPVIDRTFPLSKVSEAIGYLQEGTARGKIIIVP